MSLKSILKSIFMDKEFEEKIDFLSKIPIFDGVSKNLLGKIDSVMHLKTYFPEEVIFSEGKIGKALFIIRSGEIAITRKVGNVPDSSDRERVIAKLHDGSFFGEMALLEEMPRSATAKAIKKSDIFLIYKVRFDWLLERFPKIGVIILQNLARVLSSRIRENTESI